MPTVTVNAQSQMSPELCFERVTKLLETDQELRKLDPKYSCQFDPSSLSGQAVGKQFKANLKVTPSGEGASVQIDVELPFHLALAKGLVQKTLEKKLASVVG